MSLKLLLATLPLWLFACGVAPMKGAASFTLLSDEHDKVSSQYTAISPEIEIKDCFTAGPLFLIWVGTPPVYESLLSKVLQENKADVLLNAELKSTGYLFPYIFLRVCSTITGTPAKLRR